MTRPPVLTLEGAAFIGAFEGFSATCYDDGGRPGVGNCTIGIGHLVHMGPTTAADRRRWGRITRGQAERMLVHDAHAALLAIERHIAIKLAPWQVDALCSFAYNCGAESLAGSVGRAINARPKGWRRTPARMRTWRAAVNAAILAWDHAGGAVLPGLERRRHAELVLFFLRRYTRHQGNPFSN